MAAATPGMATDELQSTMERLFSLPYGNKREIKFLGVFAFDLIPLASLMSSDSFPRCCIINTDPIGKPGQHWVAFYRENSGLEFFDSYGNSPETYHFKFPIRGTKIVR